MGFWDRLFNPHWYLDQQIFQLQAMLADIEKRIERLEKELLVPRDKL